jgi:hypothetical protein
MHRTQLNRNLPDVRNVELPKVDAFLEEVEAVCQKHGLSIAHEDRQGGFIIEPYDAGNLEWLKAASFDPEP